MLGDAGGLVAQDAGSTAPQTIGDEPLNDPTDDDSKQDTQSETTVAANGDDVVVAFNDSGSFQCEGHFTGYSTSSDGGTAFTDRGPLPDSSEGDGGDPVLAVDHATGAFYLATLGFNTQTKIQVFTSINDGRTFGAPVNGSPGYSGTDADQDKSWLTVDNNPGTGQSNVYLCWTKYDGGYTEIRFTRSTDGAATFTPNQGVLVSDELVQGCDIVVGPDHTVYVFYLQRNGTNHLVVRKSADLGLSFGPVIEVTELLTIGINGNLDLNGGLRSNAFPHSAMNPVNGDLYVAFNDTTDDADTSDSYLVTSADGGSTWSTRLQLNDDDGNRDQFFPTVAVNGAGSELMVGYYSRVHDADNLAFHRRARLGSIASGIEPVWQDSFQVSPDTPIAIDQDPVVNPEYMGDYDQIAAGGKYFQTTWADNRYGNSFHRHQPDVFHAKVRDRPKHTDLDVHVGGPDTAAVGERFSFLVTVDNIGRRAATDVYVSDVLPAELVVKSATIDGRACDIYRQLVSCLAGTVVHDGETAQMHVVVKATEVGTFADQASVTTSSSDDDNGNDADSHSVVVS